ncbi:hypothetical protein B5S31_g5051 [[Candida] boidinii]|uniref:Unnamed protein product n=1 Tax=Candida boidinii TaxID=5477 RepID=A0ACB5U0D9_CANBO|nr:hypothetical protein B5S31_g5051 [[Candida] boidinii]GME98560.1 unnamed protein product [[Candida] boidinii]
MSLADYLAKNYTSSKKDKKLKKSKKLKDSSNSSSSSFLITSNNNLVDSNTTNSYDINHTQVQEHQNNDGNLDILNDDDINADSDNTPTLVKSNKSHKGAWKRIDTNEIVDRNVEKEETSTSNKDITIEKPNDRSHLQTVYRDLKGNKLDIDPNTVTKDISKSKDEERKKKVNEREKRLRDANESEIQKSKRSKREKNSDVIKESYKLNQSENDIDYNSMKLGEIKSDDPALSFNKNLISKYKSNNNNNSDKNISVTGRKLYTGPHPQNRFNIKPGYRWDGVDRSNGFENKWFDKQAEIREKQILSYTLAEEY